MKIFFFLFLVACGSFGLYLFLIHIKKIDRKALKISAVFALMITILLLGTMYKASKRPDAWCTTYRDSTSYPPMELTSAMDYFEQANFEYDTGDCTAAIENYTKSIELNPAYPQSYNNRAFTFMRAGEYDLALNDLNAALEIKPDYVNALMNRGDIYNYRKNDKKAAIADYERIIDLAGTRGTSVCGHLAMAKYGESFAKSIFMVPLEIMTCRK